MRMNSHHLFNGLLLACGITTAAHEIDPSTLTQAAQLIVAAIMAIAGLINLFKPKKPQ